VRPLTQVTGPAAVLDRENVDTDQIIPKQFLKRIERSGFGEFLFYDWMQDPAFELRRPEAEGATILIGGANFGCGSSREHAPWALEDYGFRVILAPSFADIFRTNCVKTGIAPVAVADADLARVKEAVAADRILTVDLERLLISHSSGLELPFGFDPFEQHLLVGGLDDVALTLARADAIAAYEAAHPARYDGRAVTAAAPR
jgi:3-isopropylmalate/(R)-2-methylmalate dehydratase small subunit